MHSPQSGCVRLAFRIYVTIWRRVHGIALYRAVPRRVMGNPTLMASMVIARRHIGCWDRLVMWGVLMVISR